MKKLLMAVALAFTFTAVSAPAYCTTGHHGKYFSFFKILKMKFLMAKKHAKNKDKPDTVESVPEIDGGQAGLALALLAGMVVVARERKRRI